MLSKFPEKYPRRMGQVWLYDEEYSLLKKIREKKSFEQIANEHERTLGGIMAKLRSFAYLYHMEGKTIDQIKFYTGLTEEQIHDAINKRYYKNIKKQATPKSISPSNELLERNVVDMLNETENGKGYIYCFTNESMPGIVKIGMTDRTPEDRLRDANRPDTFKPPSPYVVSFAKYVNNPRQKERLLHKILEKFSERINNQREFFRVPKDDVLLLFHLIEGEYWENKEVNE